MILCDSAALAECVITNLMNIHLIIRKKASATKSFLMQAFASEIAIMNNLLYNCKRSTNALIILIIKLQLICSRAESDFESDEATGGMHTRTTPVMDRVALNLADAFIKSIFPELEETTAMSAQIPQEIRRSPTHDSNIFGLTNVGRSGAYSSILNAKFDPEYDGMNQQIQSETMEDSAQPSPLENILTSMLVAQPPFDDEKSIASTDDVDEINEARSSKYLADLRRNQRELDEYTDQQMRHLDEQLRYQQALINERASAVLAMRRHHAKLIKKRMHLVARQRVRAEQNIEDAGTDDEYTEEDIDTLDSDANEEYDDRSNGNDYVVDESNDGVQLTDESYDDSDTSRNGGGGVDGRRKKTRKSSQRPGPFQVKARTEASLSMREEGTDPLPRSSQRAMGQKQHRNYGLKQHLNLSPPRIFEQICTACEAVDLRKLQGSWTQIYGNSKVLHQRFSPILSLESLRPQQVDTETTTTNNMTTTETSCVGINIYTMNFELLKVQPILDFNRTLNKGFLSRLKSNGVNYPGYVEKSNSNRRARVKLIFGDDPTGLRMHQKFACSPLAERNFFRTPYDQFIERDFHLHLPYAG
ncbi:unnamed protein product [Anisakis simplex]|uniref:F-box domain-containing protein n=1 Tax=Anisakis simplex TaxID=6269 RepID=A0A0M3JWA1_ANISI|nr:unnamed protein product [Anisakis simplex]